MQTYGLLYKQGHFVKNWQTRLFILSGGQLKYYVPGDTEAKGTIMLHNIKTVQAVTVRQNGFKIETHNKVYFCQAPDEMSLQAWMAALKPLKVGFLMKQSQEQTWKKRWCIVWRTQLAYFENHQDTKERKGYILLRDVIPERLFAIDRSVFGHDNIFQVETRERTFFMQAISGEDMDEWIREIQNAIASRGPLDEGVPPANGAEGGYAVATGSDSMLAQTQQWQQQAEYGQHQDQDQDLEEGEAESSRPDDGLETSYLDEQIMQQVAQQDHENDFQEQGMEMKEMVAQLKQRQRLLEHREKVLEAKLQQLAAQGIVVEFGPEPSFAPVQPAPAPAPIEYHAAPAPAPPPAPEPAPQVQAAPAAVNTGVVAAAQLQPRADQQQFTFLVKSDDLFTDQRKCRVFAADLGELEASLAASLGIPHGIYVLIHDEDFDEYCLPDKIAEVPQTGRIKVKAR